MSSDVKQRTRSGNVCLGAAYVLTGGIITLVISTDAAFWAIITAIITASAVGVLFGVAFTRNGE